MAYLAAMIFFYQLSDCPFFSGVSICHTFYPFIAVEDNKPTENKDSSPVPTAEANKNIEVVTKEKSDSVKTFGSAHSLKSSTSALMVN